MDANKIDRHRDIKHYFLALINFKMAKISDKIKFYTYVNIKLPCLTTTRLKDLRVKLTKETQGLKLSSAKSTSSEEISQPIWTKVMNTF
jgi:hypothetical protein